MRHPFWNWRGKTHKGSLRLSPKHGLPTCVVESAAQWIFVHRVLIYIAVVGTLTLLLELFNVHLR